MKPLTPALRRALRIPLALLFMAAFVYSCDSIRWTPPIPGGIAELYPVTINGNKQWLLIRGRDKTAPVLLFLHGGPGAAQIGTFRKYQKELEKKFIVVQWDQRGAGLSDFPEDASTLTVEQFIADGIRVTEYLKEKFNRDKIYLAGHSWGSALGWFMARDYPQHFHAYASLASLPAQNGALEQYNLTLAKAQALGNQGAVSQLEALGPPPWADPYPSMLKVFRWIRALRGDAATVNINRIVAADLLFSTEYRIGDAIGWLQKKDRGMKLMYPAFNGNVDLIGGGAEFSVPFYMILGEQDIQAPAEPAAELFEAVTAPNKKLIIYRNCAHHIMWERTDNYQAAIIRLFGVY